MPAPAQAVGIDIGGTEIGLALVRDDGRVVERRAIPTEQERGFPHSLARIEDAIRSMSGSVPIAGIGIGCAGPVSPTRGTVDNLFSLAAWRGTDIVSPLRAAFDVPVRLENDADTAAFGEWHAGAGPGGGRGLLMLTLGTGIGGGVVIDGTIYRGARGEHPEIGHVVVDPRGPQCFCGIAGCLEILASGTAIGLRGAESGLGDSRAVFAAAEAGDVRAKEIVETATSALASAAWTLSHTFMTERIVLSGGIAAQHFALFADVMRARLAKATIIPKDAIEVVQAELGNDAGVVGGAMLVLRQSS